MPCEAGRMASVAACLLAMTANGCSFVFTHDPPPHHAEMRYFDCPSNSTAPTVDTTLTVAGGVVVLLSLLVISAASSGFLGGASTDGAYGKLGLLTLPTVVLPLSSAIYGYTKVGNCRDAKNELSQRIGEEAIAAQRPFDPGSPPLERPVNPGGTPPAPPPAPPSLPAAPAASPPAPPPGPSSAPP
jgi:hypothetical protein